MPLTAKQAAFVQEYLIDLNATQAAIRAGYKEKAARFAGHENLTKPNIAVAIEEAQQKRAERTEITADRVLREYAKIGFSNITDYLKVEEIRPEGETQTYTSVSIFGTDGVPLDKMAAVAEIKETKEGIALKLHDKKGALDSIARHLGMFKDKIEHSGSMGVTIQNDIPRSKST